MQTDPERISLLNDCPVNPHGRAVVYWMQSDQRAEDNWALIRAAELANALKLPLVVMFSLYAKPRTAYVRHYDFMLRGLMETARRLRSKGIGFVLRIGDPRAKLPELVQELEAAAVVTDQNYLRWGRRVRREVAEKLEVACEAVDAATIVPPGLAYPKAAYGAYILRPKLRKLRERFVTEYPVVAVKVTWTGRCESDDGLGAPGLLGRLALDESVGRVDMPAGAMAAHAALEEFLEAGFKRYAAKRNDPTIAATSGLSPYLHFGQISSQRIAYETLNSEAYEVDPEGGEGFLDELITWRELAVNHVFYRKHYNNFSAVPAWAQKSLAAHINDPREFVYTREELERAQTHDELWNAAQIQMIRRGWMHGYMRMYWAKKILEWTDSPVSAIETAVYLNDKYFLDGRDANGYAGILWAIGGLHDRPWFDRPVYGQVRYMSYGGAKGKFDVPAYVRSVQA